MTYIVWKIGDRVRLIPDRPALSGIFISYARSGRAGTVTALYPELGNVRVQFDRGRARFPADGNFHTDDLVFLDDGDGDDT